MPNHDIIAWEDTEGYRNIMPCTKAGILWLVDHPPEDMGFQDYLETISPSLRVGVLDPTGKILNFSSGVLH